MLNREATTESTPNQEQQVAVLSLTDAAAAKFRDLTKGETNPAIGLRVYIIAGGCSGYRYGMMVEETANADDRVFETVTEPPCEHRVVVRRGADVADEARGICQVFGFAVAQGETGKNTRHFQMPLQAHPLHGAVKSAEILCPVFKIQ